MDQKPTQVELSQFSDFSWELKFSFIFGVSDVICDIWSQRQEPLNIAKAESNFLPKI